MKKQSWFKKKGTTASIAVLSFITGLFFLGQRKITGNMIRSNYYGFSLLSLIGILLVFCAIIMAVYRVKKE